GTLCNAVISHETCAAVRQPVIFNPDFFVEKLRHERPEVFAEMVLSNITRLIDLPGTEFAQLQGEVDPKLPNSGGFFRSFNFLKRKEKGAVFGMPLTEEGIAQIYQLIEYLSKNLHVEGLFRVPGNSVRQQALREMLDSGEDIDLETRDYHPNDVATLLKVFLGELPEPLLTHRHYHAHLKMTASDLQENINKLNNGMAFLIKHSQKLFRAPPYIRELARMQFAGSKTLQSKDDLDLLPSHEAEDPAAPSKRTCPDVSAGPHTEEALKELFRHVTNMPDSARKKKLIRQFVKQSTPGTPGYDCQTPPCPGKKHPRSRSFGGIIKRKVLGNQAAAADRKGRAMPSAVNVPSMKQGKENSSLTPMWREWSLEEMFETLMNVERDSAALRDHRIGAKTGNLWRRPQVTGPAVHWLTSPSAGPPVFPTLPVLSAPCGLILDVEKRGAC
ncbi:rho GTPase-activating protein 19-like, partial [Scleropages formosus]